MFCLSFRFTGFVRGSPAKIAGLGGGVRPKMGLFAPFSQRWGLAQRTPAPARGVIFRHLGTLLWYVWASGELLTTMLIRTLFFAFSTFAFVLSGYAKGPANSQALDQDTVTRLQIYLDEHSFGPGKIDGRWGEFIGKTLARFQAANGQASSGQIDSALRQELQKISPVYTPFVLTDADLAWVGKLPARPAEMAKLKKILYGSPLEYITESYHADPA